MEALIGFTDDRAASMKRSVEALIHLMLKNYDAAIEYYEQGIREQPSNIRGYIRLACALAHKGDIDAARAALDRGKKISPMTAAYLDATPLRPPRRPGVLSRRATQSRLGRLT